MQETYDCIVVLGHGFVNNWQIPAHVHDRLRTVAKMYREGASSNIVLCGKWSINWDHNHIVPPATEAAVMEKLLIKFGVPSSAISKEEKSQDTIGNVYFLKKTILAPRHFKNLLFVTADFHAKRVKFLADKILGPRYQKTYITTPTESMQDTNFMQMQEEVLQRQKLFLSGMEVGDDAYLAKRLYKDPYYQQKRPAHIAQAAQGH